MTNFQDGGVGQDISEMTCVAPDEEKSKLYLLLPVCADVRLASHLKSGLSGADHDFDTDARDKFCLDIYLMESILYKFQS